MTAERRRLVAVGAAVAIVMVTAVLVGTAGIVAPPGTVALADAPLPAIEGRVAALQGPEGERCLVLIDPATGAREEVRCDLDAERLAVRGARLLASGWEGHAVLVDPGTGDTTPASTETAPHPENCDAGIVDVHDGRLEIRTRPVDGAVVIETPAPSGYWVSDACTAPAGPGALLVDNRQRLLLADLDQGTLRLAATDVHAAVWLAPRA